MEALTCLGARIYPDCHNDGDRSMLSARAHFADVPDLTAAFLSSSSVSVLLCHTQDALQATFFPDCPTTFLLSSSTLGSRVASIPDPLCGRLQLMLLMLD
jgi:hypothetical protein